MQVKSGRDAPKLLDRLIKQALPGGRGMAAWASFLRAHASLMRLLTAELQKETGLTIGDFDVLVQLGMAGGELRMTDLAHRALTSRSGLTRRVDRLVEEGLVRRASSESDGRGVVVALTDAGVSRLAEVLPVHMRGVAQHFVDPLDDRELSVLERALAKVTVDESFG